MCVHRLWRNKLVVVHEKHPSPSFWGSNLVLQGVCHDICIWYMWTTCWKWDQTLLQELTKDMAMRWCITQGYKFGVSCDNVTKLCKKSLDLANSRDSTHSVSRNLMTMTLSWTNLDNAVTDGCLVGYSDWIVLTSKNAVCQVSTQVGTATTREEIHIKRLLWYLWEYSVQHDCGLSSGCAWNCGHTTRFGLGHDWRWSGWRCQVSSQLLWNRCLGPGLSVEDTVYPVYASSKKYNMVCLSSGESELMELVGGACKGIATREQWSKLRNCSSGTIVLSRAQTVQQSWDERIARERVDALDTWTWMSILCRPGRWNLDNASCRCMETVNKSLTDSRKLRLLKQLIDVHWVYDRRRICEHQSRSAEDRCAPNTAPDSTTFKNTFPVDMCMKFGMTRQRCSVLNKSKSGDEPTSPKETSGQCKGSAEHHNHISVSNGKNNIHHVHMWLVSSALDSVEGRVCTAHTAISLVDANELSSLCSLVGDNVALICGCVLTRDWVKEFWAIFDPWSSHSDHSVIFLVTCALMITISALSQAMDRTRARITFSAPHSCLI